MIIRCAWCGADLARTPAPDPDCRQCQGTGVVGTYLYRVLVTSRCGCVARYVSHGLCEACEAKLSGAEVA